MNIYVNHIIIIIKYTFELKPDINTLDFMTIPIDMYEKLWWLERKLPIWTLLRYKIDNILDTFDL